MVFEGFRSQTPDVNLTFEVNPENHAALIKVPRKLKEELSLNVEEASPAEFIPLPHGYRERSLFVGRFGQLNVFHFDLYSTSLSKIERGTEEDFADVLSLLRSGRINMQKLTSDFEKILPAVEVTSLKQDPQQFRRRFDALKTMFKPVVTHRRSRSYSAWKREHEPAQRKSDTEKSKEHDHSVLKPLASRIF
jgi:hypothetical protein